LQTSAATDELIEKVKGRRNQPLEKAYAVMLCGHDPGEGEARVE
jgi:transposase-like protein